MICPTCGKIAPDDAAYCPECGGSLKASELEAPDEQELKSAKIILWVLIGLVILLAIALVVGIFVAPSRRISKNLIPASTAPISGHEKYSYRYDVNYGQLIVQQESKDDSADAIKKGTPYIDPWLIPLVDTSAKGGSNLLLLALSDEYSMEGLEEYILINYPLIKDGTIQSIRIDRGDNNNMPDFTFTAQDGKVVEVNKQKVVRNSRERITAIGSKRFYYNRHGQLTSIEDAEDGSVYTALQYDKEGRLIQVAYPEATLYNLTTTYNYKGESTFPASIVITNQGEDDRSSWDDAYTTIVKLTDGHVASLKVVTQTSEKLESGREVKFNYTQTVTCGYQDITKIKQ